MDEPRRLGKQFIYAVLYLALFGGIAYSVYFVTLRPGPSCTDGKLNQDEEQTDCGGANCAPCELATLKPIQISGVLIFRDDAVALIKLTNPNPNFGITRLPYKVVVTGNNEQDAMRDFEEETFIYPGQTNKHIIWPLEQAGPVETIENFQIKLGTEFDWVKSEQFPKPRMEFRGLSIREENGKIIASGGVQNHETLLFPRITIGAILISAAGEPIGLSRTEVRDVKAFEERYFQLEHPPLADAVLQNTLLFFEALRP